MMKLEQVYRLHQLLGFGSGPPLRYVRMPSRGGEAVMTSYHHPRISRSRRRRLAIIRSFTRFPQRWVIPAESNPGTYTWNVGRVWEKP